MREETHESTIAIRSVTEKANAQHKSPDPVEPCRLFKVYLASESINGLRTNAQTCGVPAEIIKQAAREGYGKAAEIGKQGCEAAEHPTQSGRRVVPLRLSFLERDQVTGPAPVISKGREMDRSPGSGSLSRFGDSCWCFSDTPFRTHLWVNQ
jgi:hypothetical protein